MKSRRLRVLCFAIIATCLPFMIATPGAQAVGIYDELWTESPHTTGPVEFNGGVHSTYLLDENSLRVRVGSSTGARGRVRTADDLPVPAPNGEIVRFSTHPVDLMDSDLSDLHPELHAFAGTAVGDSSISIRGDVTPGGVHLTVRYKGSPERDWYVDPVNPKRSADGYVSYSAGSLDIPRESNPNDLDSPSDGNPPIDHRSSVEDGAGAEVQVRRVRVALASDPSFARFYGTENVLSAKFAILNRVADVYNADLATHLVLANGTDLLNFDTEAKAFGSNGPCGVDSCYVANDMGSCTVNSLYQNRTAIRTLIGDNNYDVGHLLLGNAGGGLAGYGEIGLYDAKGGGCSGTGAPTGDAFAIDYVAHELGHQFGGSHTYNACGGSSGSTAVEPGSGSTVMAYAGICGSNDLQPHTDPYFSTVSIEEIHRTLDSRIPAVSSQNHNPLVVAPPSKTIPSRTPFTLTAAGSDPDGDPLTFMWEQINVGDPDRALLDGGKTSGPLFRVFGSAADISPDSANTYYSAGQNHAAGSPSRSFPDIEQVERGITDASSGDCALFDGTQRRDCYSEFLPTEGYVGDLSFRVTARDGRLDGGGISTSNVSLPIDHTAGPLQMDPLPTSGPLKGDSMVRVTWQVNGTDKPELAPTVRITASSTGDGVYDSVLLPATLNNGAADVRLPNVDGSIRLRVEAVDNYFFAVSPQPLQIQAEDVPAPTTGTEPETTIPSAPKAADLPSSTELKPAGLGHSVNATATTGLLADTGANDSSSTLWAAALLAGVGGLLVWAQRRKRRN